MVDGKMAFPLSRSIASLLTLTQHQPPTTNHPATSHGRRPDQFAQLYSYKTPFGCCSYRVADPSSPYWSICYIFLIRILSLTILFLPRNPHRCGIPPPSTPNIRRRCPTYPLKGAPANPRRPHACSRRSPDPAYVLSPPNHPANSHPQLKYPTRRLSSCAAPAAGDPGSERRSRSQARGAPASEESTGPGVVGLQYRR